ncbi:hypothetical protein UA08_03463 [Talaromyces atroroseus]|uniref:Uncharacterized protein n=1 Tax=Talaromyces atroroseus TaxID=1441469 RepID=A0A225AJR2_TALAT|nr:hypothetical protein UA08_03463 [Talaromyces atroroseus]OKL61110.1 hypothetical protein UA08_03463 [Talaromyces atroroseus]
MAQQPHGLSRTLPKSFTFSSLESTYPKTPEHPRVEPQIPPPPRHSSYRARRPRFDSHASIFSSLSAEPNIFDLSRPDDPLPSIEVPHSDTVSEPDIPTIQPVSSEFLQVPASRRMEFKTPPAQIRTTPFNFPRATPEPVDDAEADPIERPSSRASNSSVSSIETYTTQPSLGGSCTSPESEIFDPFSFQPADTRKHLLETPPTKHANRGQSLDLPKRKSRWTADMDSHLWNTYQMYLQDPTTTPFKTLPGSLPPLGVSHRVAREAKKTWTRLKSKTDHETPLISINADDSAVLIEGSSGSSTPTANKSKPRWPRSEAATRRRLKYLCKRKLSIAPHYQRLLQSRSPSPFLDVFSAPARRPVGPVFDHNSSAAFMTRDLGVSLVSSSLPATFTQFAAVEPLSTEGSATAEHSHHSESQQSSHQDSAIPIPTIPSHLSVAQEPFPRLGSPFMYNTWGPDTSRREAHGGAARRLRRDTIHVSGSRLRTPPRMDVPSNVHKRRAHHRLDSSPNLTDIQRNVRDLARDGKLKDGQRRVRLRNRGNTTSGGFSSKERVEQLFSPTSPFTFPGNQDSSPQVSQGLLRPRAETIRRLGSPFRLDSGPRFQYPKSPRHAPSLSDPFMNSSIKSQVHLEHQSGSSSAEPHVPPGRLPYDPTEEGISDAERIRRQILNLPFTKHSM